MNLARKSLSSLIRLNSNILSTNKFHSTTSLVQEIEETKHNEINIKRIKLEHSMLLLEGVRVPEVLSDFMINELLYIKSASQRKKHFEFLQSKIYLKQKRRERKKVQDMLPKDNISSSLQDKNKMFFRIRKQTITQFEEMRQITNMPFANSLLFDFDYESSMSIAEKGMLAKQMVELISLNREHFNPFNIHFYNYSGEGFFHEKFFKSGIDLLLPPKSHDYLQDFSKEKLVYLTPNAPTNLRRYDHDATYVVGAIVDKSGQGPLSFSKAKQQNIKMARLPLENYIKWRGSKALSLPILLKILHDFKETDDWEYSLRHISLRSREVPSRYAVDSPDKDLRAMRLPRRLFDLPES